jgi:hypothetical protein
MAHAVGYDFEELLMKKGAYNPQAHADIEQDQFLIRKNLIRLLGGELSLKMEVISGPQPGEKELQRQ